MIKVLITEAQCIHTLVIARYLATSGVEVHVIGVRPEVVTFYSKYCRRKIIRPKSDLEFLRLLMSLLRENYDVFIPVGFNSCEFASKNKDLLSKMVGLAIADFENFSLAADRKALYGVARKLGVQYPVTYFPETYAEAESMSHDVVLPSVVKSRFEKGGRSVVGYAVVIVSFSGSTISLGRQCQPVKSYP
jgi:predicted ATP-grasp superfamily ATP-dependent carboligase